MTLDDYKRLVTESFLRAVGGKLSRQKSGGRAHSRLGREITVEALTQAALRLQAMGAGVRAKIGVRTGPIWPVFASAFYTHMKRSGQRNRDLGCTPAQLEQMKDDYYASSKDGT